MAVRFNAASDRMLRTSNLLSINANYTVMMWAKIVTDTNDYVTFWGLNNNSTATALDVLGTDSDGTSLGAIWVDNGGGADLSFGTNLSTGTWYHIAMVRASASSRVVYLNGSVDVNLTSNSGTRTTSSRMEIGAQGTGNEYPLNGTVANVLLYDTNLSQSQIQAQMYRHLPVEFDNLVGWYPCLAGSSERLMDYSGLGYNWTESGTLTDENAPPISWGTSSVTYEAATAVSGRILGALAGEGGLAGMGGIAGKGGGLAG